MNITFNGNVYVVDRISLLAREGTRIQVQMKDLVEQESAPTHNGDYACVAAVGKTQFKVLLAPAAGFNEKTVVYLLSKIVLKKCLANAEYVSTNVYTPPTYRERDRSTQNYGSHRPQGDRPRTWNR